MTGPTDINPHIVEALYNEALTLADDVRGSFDLSGRLEEAGQDEDIARVALSCEALRTTTRMMHAIAWLLNQRAYFHGELSEFQLRRHGRLPPSQQKSDPAQVAMLPDTMASLVHRSERFYARIERLDEAWRTRFAMQPMAIHRLRDRLGRSMGMA